MIEALPSTQDVPGRVQHCWVQGQVRVTLIGGDCLEIAPTLTGIDAVVSDPPYGIGYQHGVVKRSPGTLEGGKRLKPHQYANLSTIVGDDQDFDPAPWLSYPTVVLWGANHFAGFLPKGQWLAWDKHIGVGPNDDCTDCEFAWTNAKTKRNVFRHLWKGLVCSKQGEDIMVASQFKRLHVSQKPVALMAWCLDQAKVPVGATVLDPYMGSGSTGLACLKTGRNFIGIEKDPIAFTTALARFHRVMEQGALPLHLNISAQRREENL